MPVKVWEGKWRGDQKKVWVGWETALKQKQYTCYNPINARM